MRTRAYRPEAPGYLEDRELLSGLARASAHPVVFLNRNLTVVVNHEQSETQVFARGHALAIDVLRDDLRDVAVMIPFGKVDGLGVTINHILDTMEQNLAAGVPHAVRSATQAMIAATRGEVRARVRAGDVILL